MRLINADALKTKIQKIKAEALEHGFAPESVCGDILLNFLDNAPTIEAKPIVHAHWREWWPPQEFILTGEEKLYICSNCDAKYSDVENQRFCPWCGAQMDEIVSDNNVGSKTEGVKIPVISMEDVPKLAKEMEK